MKFRSVKVIKVSLSADDLIARAGKNNLRPLSKHKSYVEKKIVPRTLSSEVPLNRSFEIVLNMSLYNF